MTFRTLIRRSLRYHWRAHLGVVLGAAIGSAALIGALVVGDSVRESLREVALERVGWVDAAMVLRDRFFSSKLAEHFQPTNAWQTLATAKAAALLELPATAVRQDGAARANDVNVLGVDPNFSLTNGVLRDIPKSASF